MNKIKEWYASKDESEKNICKLLVVLFGAFILAGCAVGANALIQPEIYEADEIEEMLEYSSNWNMNLYDVVEFDETIIYVFEDNLQEDLISIEVSKQCEMVLGVEIVSRNFGNCMHYAITFKDGSPILDAVMIDGEIEYHDGLVYFVYGSFDIDSTY